MTSPFYIVGPTAVGKSDIALEVAERCDGEILGADAFQLYEGLDLLSAKPTIRARLRVPHHLVGCIPIHEAYNVAKYHADAKRCLENLVIRSKPAIVVGGSGLYVKALTHGLSPLPAAQVHLRTELEKLDLTSLLHQLQVLDPVTALAIDAKNKRRLVRAVEVCLITGRRYSDHQSLWSNVVAKASVPIGILCVRDRDDLHERINHRVELMFPAVLEEVHAVTREHLSATAAKMIGFAQISDCLDGLISQRECKERIKVATRQYAKRQMTWFKREPDFLTVNLSEKPDCQSIVQEAMHAVARYQSLKTP